MLFAKDFILYNLCKAEQKVSNYYLSTLEKSSSLLHIISKSNYVCQYRFAHFLTFAKRKLTLVRDGMFLICLEQGCTTHFSWRAKKIFCQYPRAKMLC